MKKNPSIYNDEIDIVELSKNIWDGKIKIILITLIAIIINISINKINQINQKPSLFEFSLEIRAIENRNFIEFIPINIFLNKYQNKQTVRIKDINEVTIFNRFIEELLDYDELISVLEKNALVKKNISNLPKKDQQTKIYTFVKSFIIERKGDSAILKFTWHNVDEGKKILTDTLNSVLINLEKKIIKDLNDITKIIKNLKKTRLLELNIDIRNTMHYIEQEVILYKLKDVADAFDSIINSINLIEAKIKISEKELYEDILMFEKEILFLKSNNDIDWVNYKLPLINVKSTEKTKNYKKSYVISIIFGLLAGVFYVLIENAIRSRKFLKKK